MYKTTTLTYQGSVHVQTRRSADRRCGTAECRLHDGNSTKIPLTLLLGAHQGEERIPLLILSTKWKKREEEFVGFFRLYSWTSPNLLIEDKEVQLYADAKRLHQLGCSLRPKSEVTRFITQKHTLICMSACIVCTNSILCLLYVQPQGRVLLFKLVCTNSNQQYGTIGSHALLL